MIASLYNLIYKDRKFEWTSKANKAFKKLKQKFLKDTILVIFNPQKPLIIEIDISNYTINSTIN